MERRGDEVPLPCEDDLVSVPCERPASPPGPHDRRSADEHASERAVEALDREIDLEGLPLPSEGVPVPGHVHEPPEARLRLLRLGAPLLREEDAAGARAEDGHGFLLRAPYDLE